MVEERVSKLEGAYEQVDQRLGDLRGEMRALRGDMNGLRGEMSELRADMEARFEAQRGEMNALREGMDARFEAQRRDVNGKLNTMIVVIGTVGAAGVAALGGVVASLVMLALRI